MGFLFIYLFFYCGSSFSASVLFAGAKVGHRSLMRYYKQRFGAQRAVAVAHNQRAVGRVLKQYRALGWGGESGEELVQIFSRL